MIKHFTTLFCLCIGIQYAFAQCYPATFRSSHVERKVNSTSNCNFSVSVSLTNTEHEGISVQAVSAQGDNLGKQTFLNPYEDTFVFSSLCSTPPQVLMITSYDNTTTREQLVYCPLDFDLSSLPVTFGYLQAQSQGKRVKLTWKTYSETNNSGFEIQHSTDGIHFSSIGFVSSIQPNTKEEQNYTYVNHSPFEGVSFYRLKQIDLDSKTTYSHVVSSFVRKETLALNPSVASVGTPIQIRLAYNTRGSLRIINALGQTVDTQTINSYQSTTTLQTSYLPQGIYWVEQQSSNRAPQISQLILY